MQPPDYTFRIGDDGKRVLLTLKQGFQLADFDQELKYWQAFFRSAVNDPRFKDLDTIGIIETVAYSRPNTLSDVRKIFVKLHQLGVDKDIEKFKGLAFHYDEANFFVYEVLSMTRLFILKLGVACKLFKTLDDAFQWAENLDAVLKT
jgi:hypothetical protein